MERLLRPGGWTRRPARELLDELAGHRDANTAAGTPADLAASPRASVRRELDP